MIDTQTKIRCCNVDLEALEFDGETVLCRVCGDKASGFHYGVHACEGCKGFFRRSIQQKIQYRPCLKNQECTISRVNRNRCQYCRLKKCIAVGMSRDAVRFGRVPKKEKAKILEQMQKVNLSSQTNYLSAILQNDNHVISQTIKAHAQTNEFTREKFERFQKRSWQKPEFITCSSNKACPLNSRPDSDSDKRWNELSDSFTPAIQSVVDFAKAIPGFTVLNQEDQVTLLKAGTFEVLLLRLSCLFDCRTNTMLFVDGRLYKKNSSEEGTGGFLQESMFEFAERLNDLKLNDDELGLFAGIVIIAANRPGLRNPEHVESIQSKLTHGLSSMMLQNHPDDPALFGKLLMKIPDLRTLNALHSEKLLGMSLQHQAAKKQQTDCPMENDRLEPVVDQPPTHCPYSDNQRLVIPTVPCQPPKHVQQQQQQQQQPQFPTTMQQNGNNSHGFQPFLSNHSVSSMLPANVNSKHQDFTALPKYQSQLEMVKKIKAEMTSQPQQTTQEHFEPSLSNRKSVSELLKKSQALKQNGYPVDEYLQASMMSHLKQKVMTPSEKDRFQTVRGMLNSGPHELMYPYYPYMYPNEMLYQYYPYRFPPAPFMNAASHHNRATDFQGRIAFPEMKKEFRDRSPPPSPRWRLGSTGSRTSPKTEDSNNSSSRSSPSWNAGSKSPDLNVGSPESMYPSPRGESHSRVSPARISPTALSPVSATSETASPPGVTISTPIVQSGSPPIQGPRPSPPLRDVRASSPLRVPSIPIGIFDPSSRLRKSSISPPQHASSPASAAIPFGGQGSRLQQISPPIGGPLMTSFRVGSPASDSDRHSPSQRSVSNHSGQEPLNLSMSSVSSDD